MLELDLVTFAVNSESRANAGARICLHILEFKLNFFVFAFVFFLRSRFEEVGFFLFFVFPLTYNFGAICDVAYR